MVSATLRQALRTHGAYKIASEIAAERGQPLVPEIVFQGPLEDMLGRVVEHFSQKIALQHLNQRRTREGLLSYAYLEDLR